MTEINLDDAERRYCNYGYPLGGINENSPRIEWCGLNHGHAGLHISGRGAPGFTDAGTVRRASERNREVERLNGMLADAKYTNGQILARHDNACEELERAQAKLDNEEVSHNQTIAERNRAIEEVQRLRAIADDAQYDFGNLLCVEGECDHADEHDVPCPLVEQRYATADDVLELHRLRTLIERIKELTVSTDGDPLGHDEEIPVGEIVRVLAESESAEVRS